MVHLLFPEEEYIDFEKFVKHILEKQHLYMERKPALEAHENVPLWKKELWDF